MGQTVLYCYRLFHITSHRLHTRYHKNDQYNNIIADWDTGGLNCCIKDSHCPRQGALRPSIHFLSSLSYFLFLFRTCPHDIKGKGFKFTDHSVSRRSSLLSRKYCFPFHLFMYVFVNELLLFFFDIY